MFSRTLSIGVDPSRCFNRIGNLPGHAKLAHDLLAVMVTLTRLVKWLRGVLDPDVTCSERYDNNSRKGDRILLNQTKREPPAGVKVSQLWLLPK
jgi:hypothetical protein